MSIVTPPILTKLHDAEIDYLTPVQEQALQKLIQNMNFLGSLIAIGSIIYVNTGQPGVAIPDPDLWQICDGTEILNPFSPLASIGIETRFTPDLRNKFARCALDADVNGTGGNNVYDAEHSHGGETGETTPSPNVYWEGGLFGPHDRRKGDTHKHDLTTALTDEITVDYPAHLKVNAYMKIV